MPKHARRRVLVRVPLSSAFVRLHRLLQVGPVLLEDLGDLLCFQRRRQSTALSMGNSFASQPTCVALTLPVCSLPEPAPLEEDLDRPLERRDGDCMCVRCKCRGEIGGG